MTTKPEVLALIARTGKALANGNRLEILELVAQRERGVNDLARIAKLNVTSVSAHLQVLRDAGLVTSRRHGTHVEYQLAGDDVAQLLVVLESVAERHRPDVQSARRDYLPATEGSVTRAELADLPQTGHVFVLDVRPSDEYHAGHVPGSVNVPVDELPERLHEIPQGVTVVTYCRGRYCMLAYRASAVLRENGWDTRVLDKGVVEWRALAATRVAS